jgi:threonine dehydratase
MPTTALAVKQEGAKQLGAEVILEGTTSLERRARAESIARERCLAVVPGFDHPHVVAGQGTVGLELAEQWPDVDAVLVPVGGGGLIAGIATVLKNANPEIRIIGVEPTGARSMALALAENKPVTIPKPLSIADGLTANRVSELTLTHAQRYVDSVVDVSDDAIRSAAAFLLHRAKLVVEFSGAATVAALLSGVAGLEGNRVIAVLSGGNIDIPQLKSLLS